MPQDTSILAAVGKNVDIINFFKYSCVTSHWKNTFNQIQKKNLKQDLKIHQKGYVGQRRPRGLLVCVWRDLFTSCGEVSVDFLGIFFSKLCILAFYKKVLICPQLNTPRSKRIMKIVHVTSKHQTSWVSISDLDFICI